MNRIKVGIIGAGNWAKYGHIPALKVLPQYEITAVSIRQQRQADELGEQFGIPLRFSDASQLIESSAVDLVVVLPPAPQHAGFVKAAIAAGKNVYSEWPLTTSTQESEELLLLASAKGVRHAVGLQRRLGPSARFVRDLIKDGYVGQVRSVRMHVSLPYFDEDRSPSLSWSIPKENFSHLLSIYTGHFGDLLSHVVASLKTVSALAVPQFPELFLSATGERFPNENADEIVAIGTLDDGAIYSLQIEAGKRNNSGLQIDITGMDGDLKICNPLSFQNKDDNFVEGAQGRKGIWSPLAIPKKYSLIDSSLDTSVLDLAQLYHSFAEGIIDADLRAPDFRDAVKMHRFIDAIQESSDSGTLQTIR